MLFKKITVILMLLVFGYPYNAQAEEPSFPFSPGERLVLQLRWSFIPAGEAVMEVLPTASVNGADARHFALTVKTNSFVDAFYKVRDRIDAFTDMQMNHSVLYQKDQHEGKTRRDVVVTFDHENNTAQYTNFNEKRDPIPILPGSFDPFSALYFVRRLNLESNSAVERPVTDGKKSVLGILRVVKRETIKIRGRSYDTWLIEPDLKHVGGVFKKSPKAKLQLWITADKQRIPVRIKSRVVVGSFIGELVSATVGAQN